MEHAIHLGAGHFIKTVSPTSTPALMKKINRAFCNTQMHDETVNLDALDAGLSGFGEEYDGNDQDDDGDDEESSEFGVGDTIGKALALVKQVGQLHSNSIIYINSALQIRSSPQARTFFNKSCKQADVPILELMLWIHTRWASMHSFLARMLLLQKVCILNLFINMLSKFMPYWQGINLFVELADDSEDIPDLTGKSYADLRLDKKDWEKIKLMHDVLQVRTLSLVYR